VQGNGDPADHEVEDEAGAIAQNENMNLNCSEVHRMGRN
jgi:hypothetical protein